MIIAIYHCSIKIISHGKGKSAVAAAAYRSGEKITNDYDGTLHDFTKKGGVVHTEILLPKNALREFSDRSTLWNAVEKIEKSKNAQLAREIEIALPNDFLKRNVSLLQRNLHSGLLLTMECVPMSVFTIRIRNNPISTHTLC